MFVTARLEGEIALFDMNPAVVTQQNWNLKK